MSRSARSTRFLIKSNPEISRLRKSIQDNMQELNQIKILGIFSWKILKLIIIIKILHILMKMSLKEIFSKNLWKSGLRKSYMNLFKIIHDSRFLWKLLRKKYYCAYQDLSIIISWGSQELSATPVLCEWLNLKCFFPSVPFRFWFRWFDGRT